MSWSYIVQDSGGPVHLAPTEETRPFGSTVMSRCSLVTGLLMKTQPPGTAVCRICERSATAEERRPAGRTRRAAAPPGKPAMPRPAPAPQVVTCASCGKTSASQVLARCWNCGADLEAEWRAHRVPAAVPA